MATVYPPTRSSHTEPARCPCGSTLPLPDCCARYHAGPLHLQAPTAEALMRSRYTAFVLARPDYLLATWHPTTRPTHVDPDPPGLQWLGLKVIRHAPDPAAPHDPTRALVEFVARHRLAGRATRLHEISRFVREQAHWLYLDALPDPLETFDRLRRRVGG